MGDEAADSPVLKITIKQEAEAGHSGQPRFTMTSEGISTPATQTEVLNSVPLDPECRLSPIFAVGKYVKCAVPNCNNYFDGQRQEFMGISYFPFPEDPALRKEWMIAIELPPDTSSENMKVCSNHFLTQDFASEKNEVTKLNPDAKPSINISKKNKFAMTKKSMMVAESAMYDASGQFIGLDNPLMDTSGDAAAARSSKSRTQMPVIMSVHSMSQLSTDGAQGGVTPPVPMPGATVKAARRQTKTLVTYPCNKKPRSKRPALEVADFLSGEEVVTASDDSGAETRPSSKNPEKGLIVVPASVKLPPRRPKVDLVGDSFGGDVAPTPTKAAVVREEVPLRVESDSSVPTKEPGSQSPRTSTQSDTPKASKQPLVRETSKQSDEPGTSKQSDEPGTDKQSNEPGTSKQSDGPVAFDTPTHFRTRRKRRNQEEMRRQEEEDEWEPSFWRRRTLVREGFGEQLKADRKRKNDTKLKYSSRFFTISGPGPSAMNSSARSEDDGLLREDEGWRVVEPISSGKDKSDAEPSDDDGGNNPLSLLEVSIGDGKQSPPPVRRRPGPASKTCRPRYTPPKESEQSKSDAYGTDSDDSVSILSDVARTGPENSNTVGNGKPSSVDSDVYNSSLLVDWSFFKSLIPDMGRLSHEKRMLLKSFILDTLNARIYEGKPISLQDVDERPTDEVPSSVAIAE